MEKIFLFGNGNIDFDIFLTKYKNVIDKAIINNFHFLVCDFRGTDVLILEYLKTRTKNVTIYHCFENPRYLPDKFKTFVSSWNIKSGFTDDNSRDLEAINDCDYYFALDFNSDNKRKSGTLKNIEKLNSLSKKYYN